MLWWSDIEKVDKNPRWRTQAIKIEMKNPIKREIVGGKLNKNIVQRWQNLGMLIL